MGYLIVIDVEVFRQSTLIVISGENGIGPQEHLEIIVQTLNTFVKYGLKGELWEAKNTLLRERNRAFGQRSPRMGFQIFIQKIK